MAIRIRCPGCATQFEFSNELVGNTIRCRACREVFRLPDVAPEDDVPVVSAVNEPAPQHRIQPKPVVSVPPVRTERESPRLPPPERKSSAAVWIVVLLFGGALLLGGLGLAAIAIIYFFNQSPSSATPAVAEIPTP